MGRKIKQPATEPAVQLARLCKQLLWWHQLATVNHASFRCRFDGESDLLAKLCDEVLTFQTLSLFAGIIEEGSRGKDSRNTFLGEQHPPTGADEDE